MTAHPPAFYLGDTAYLHDGHAMVQVKVVKRDMVKVEYPDGVWRLRPFGVLRRCPSASA